MISIGITGGIGSGKSTVSGYLSSLGYTVIDADRISHEITAKGSSLLPRLSAVFGEHIISETGELDRKALAAIVFADSEKNNKLKAIVTSSVISAMLDRKNELKKEGTDDIVFFDIPLLFETGCEFLCDYIWVIAADLDVRIRRIMKRDGATYAEILSRINSQMSQDEKIKKADEVLFNNENETSLKAKVERLISKYERY